MANLHVYQLRCVCLLQADAIYQKARAVFEAEQEAVHSQESFAGNPQGVPSYPAEDDPFFRGRLNPPLRQQSQDKVASGGLPPHSAFDSAPPENLYGPYQQQNLHVRRRSLGGDVRGASGLDSVPEGQPLHRSYTLPPTLEIAKDEAQDESRDNWLNMPQDMDMQVTFSCMHPERMQLRPGSTCSILTKLSIINASFTSASLVSLKEARIFKIKLLIFPQAQR